MGLPFAFLAEVVQVLGLTMPRDGALAVVNTFLRDDAILPRNIDALDDVKKLVPDDRFRDEGVVAVQHLLPTSLALFEALVEKGMDPSRIHVLGTPYGTNPLIVAVLMLMGVDAEIGRDAIGATHSFEEQRIVDIHKFMQRHYEALVKGRPPGGYMLLDDGGLLQLAAGGDKLPASMPAQMKGQWTKALADLFPPDTHAVEQTTRGITELSKKGPRFPTVSVAQCDAKKLEGDVIGHALVDSLLTALAQRDRLDAKTVTVVSAGTVGTQTALILRELGYDVTLVDTHAKKRAAAEARGFKTAPVVDEDLAAGSDVLYSCTGRTAISGDVLGRFDGVLVSGSSMAIEFDTRQLASFRTSPLDVVNRARPANFDGTGHENLTKAQIGVTRAILFAALAQDIDRTKPTFVDVDRQMQDVAIAAWHRTGGGTQPHPTKPARDDRVRPDALDPLADSARHDEWIAFLAGLKRPVCPRPTENLRTPMPYFFEGEDGGVRLVDTSGDGKSRAVPLPGVPEHVWMADTGPGAALVVVCKTDEGRQLFEVVPGDPPRATSKGLVGVEAGSFLDPVTDGFSPWSRPEGYKRGFAFRSATSSELVVRTPGGAWRRVPMPKLDEARTTLLWVHRDVVLALDKGADGRAARLAPVVLSDDTRAKKAAGAVGLPGGMTTVDAVAHWDDPSLLVHPVVVLGHDAAGKPVAGVLSPVPSTAPLPLPDDAIFRNLKPSPGGKPGTFVVEYTLPGDPVESEHFRSVVLDAFANLKPDDEAAFSLSARLREAMDT